jgi:hypothetical protein
MIGTPLQKTFPGLPFGNCKIETELKIFREKKKNGEIFTHLQKMWLKGSCWSKWKYTSNNEIIHFRIVYWITSVVVDVDRDHCLNCWVCYCKKERIKLQFRFWMLCANWIVSSALDGCECSNCSLYYKTNQTAFWMLWADWIVSFVVGGCDCSLYCQIRSWREIYVATKYSVF